MGRIITDEAVSATHSDQTLIFDSPKQRLDFYRREIQYEMNILSNRTNAYLASQSFLVIAYASSMANMNPEWGKLFTLVVPLMMSILGIVSSVHAWPGIQAAYQIIDHWYYKQSNLLQNDPSMGRAYDDSPLFTKQESTHGGYRKALLFSMRTPWIFGVFWLLLGAFGVYVHYDNPVI
jgi:hypothetical protein